MKENNKKPDSEEKPNSNRPSFIKISSGAKVDGLIMKRNTFIGSADVINNEGELKNAELDNNVQIIQGVSQKTRWWEKTWVQILFLLGAIAGIVGLYSPFK